MNAFPGSRFEHLLTAGEPVVKVRLDSLRGSSPREAGATMFVATRDIEGTIGGGRLEFIAVDRARKMLAHNEPSATLDVPLGPDIGQCCGGRVRVELRRLSREECRTEWLAIGNRRTERPNVLIFGAGHVGRAAARAFALLPVNTRIVDSRTHELLQVDADVEIRQSAIPEFFVREARPGSAFVVVTHDHGLDFLIAAEALARGDAAYVGMIGSKTKRASFEHWLPRNDYDARLADRLICPMGAQGSRDKRPEVIAAFVAAEVIAALTAGKRLPKNQQPALMEEQVA